jgi:hypothetical protein
MQGLLLLHSIDVKPVLHTSRPGPPAVLEYLMYVVPSATLSGECMPFRRVSARVATSVALIGTDAEYSTLRVSYMMFFRIQPEDSVCLRSFTECIVELLIMR